MINEQIENLKKKIAELEQQKKEYVVKPGDWWGKHKFTSPIRDAKKELRYLTGVGDPVYKIRDTNTGLYSNGLVRPSNKETTVGWSKKGKMWTSEALVKKHLMKCITDAHGIPDNWEVVKLIEEPVKSMDEWIDAQMLVEILKHTKKE